MNRSQTLPSILLVGLYDKCLLSPSALALFVIPGCDALLMAVSGMPRWSAQVNLRLNCPTFEAHRSVLVSGPVENSQMLSDADLPAS